MLNVESPVITEMAGEYRVNLPAFEGPLDLLLYLIRKNDLDIRDIPMAQLTEEYVHYLDSMQALDIDLVGEFLLMAAELTHIKSQLLLPVAPPEAEAEEEGDPRADLVRRLLEYQRYKEAAAELERRPMLMREIFPTAVPPDLAETAVERPLAVGNVYMLVEAFDRVLRALPPERAHTVEVDRISVNQRVMQLMERLEPQRTVALEDLLVQYTSRYEIVVTFLALLEMARLVVITLFQAGGGTPLYVTRRADAPAIDLTMVQRM
ncbi:MAG: segregation/condensation protein A [Deltaproteobacteria bacterium]|nr:segregation/condensation protein A [Deltaproteobacteria bacterium]